VKDIDPIIVICVDGFDPEYFDVIDTPNIDGLIKNGGFYCIGKSMWPSVTNVNNVSILTGEYIKTKKIKNVIKKDSEKLL